jgi:hypothetical protein
MLPAHRLVTLGRLKSKLLHDVMAAVMQPASWRGVGNCAAVQQGRPLLQAPRLFRPAHTIAAGTLGNLVPLRVRWGKAAGTLDALQLVFARSAMYSIAKAFCCCNRIAVHAFRINQRLCARASWHAVQPRQPAGARHHFGCCLPRAAAADVPRP